MDDSDDDHYSFELIDSDDLHAEQTERSDDGSYDFLGSEELNFVVEGIEELNCAGNIHEENELGYSDRERGGIMDPDEIRSDDHGVSSKISQGSAVDEIDVLGRLHHIAVPYDSADGTFVHKFPANIKLKEDMQIKDVAKDHVLPFLPAKTLLRFRSVSKDWDQWIRHPFLAHRQSCYFREISGFFCQTEFSHYFESLNHPACGIPDPSLQFLPERVKIKTSCNGLLLCHGIDNENMYYVCNPANGKFDVLPPSCFYYGQQPNIILAFEPSARNLGPYYQVICAFDLLDGPPVLYFDIYSSETRSWSCSNAVCAEIGDSVLKDNGFYMNGVAYWETSSGELLAFDAKNDLCGIVPIPYTIKAEGILTAMDGEVSYIQAYVHDPYEDKRSNRCIIEIFGGVNMCLKRRISIDIGFATWWGAECKVLLSVNKNVLIFLLGGVIYSCNILDRKIENIKRVEYTSGDLYIPYMNSLASLP